MQLNFVLSISLHWSLRWSLIAIDFHPLSHPILITFEPFEAFKLLKEFIALSTGKPSSWSLISLKIFGKSFDLQILISSPVHEFHMLTNTREVRLYGPQMIFWPFEADDINLRFLIHSMIKFDVKFNVKFKLMWTFITFDPNWSALRIPQTMLSSTTCWRVSTRYYLANGHQENDHLAIRRKWPPIDRPLESVHFTL